MSRTDLIEKERSAFRAAAALVALVLLQAAPSHAAELYRWTDAQGTVHYTDKPPRGVEAEKLNKGRTPTLSAPTTTPAEPAVVSEEQKRREDRCRLERERLNTLLNSREIRMKDQDGGLRVLSAEEVQHEIELSNSAVGRFCSPAKPAS